MKLIGFVFSLGSVAAVLTIFGQGRAPQSETRRLHNLDLARPVSEGLTPAKKLELASAYGKFPLSFEANQGQTNPRVKFLSRGSGYSLFLTPTEAVLTLRSSSRESQVKGQKAVAERPGLLSGRAAANKFRKERSAADLQDKSAVQEAVLRMKLVGANPAPKISGVDELPGKTNYFIGNDPKKWRTNVPTYAKVNYQRVYPGVDLVYHGTQGKLEYDFVVAPGADPGVIRLSFEGAERLELGAQGDLVLRTAAGELRQHKPVVYQEVAGARHAVSGSYVSRGQSEVGFEIARYDASQPLIIDPVLSYSTYLGGGNFDEGLGIAVDSAGNAYVAGSTGSTNFPTTTGAFQTTFGGGRNAFVTKLNPTGSALVYSTYLGGSLFDEGLGIAVDATGSAYVTGDTQSSNFPTTPGAFQTTFGGGFSDAFVTKLNPTGTALVYSTYLGGDNFDGSSGIAVDSGGNAYVAGGTDSANFPTTPTAFQTTFGGGTCFGGPCFDAFVTKLNPTGTARVYSTFLGGGDSDTGNAIALDSSGNAYVTGGTGSADFPTTPGAFQMTYGGGICGVPPNALPCPDAFVTKLNPTGTAPPVYSTYLGGSSFFDVGFGIAVDPGCGPAPAAPCNAYITGFTESANFPTTPTAFQTTFGGFSDAFVTKLNPTGTAPLVYSTYLGGSNLDEGSGIAVDSGGIAYVKGGTGSANFPTTPTAFQTTLGGGFDAFVTKLNPTGTAPLVYSTYLGGSSYEQLDPSFFGAIVHSGITVDSLGSAYVTGITSSTDFPTTAGAFQPAFGGDDGDAFVAKIVEPNAELGVTLTPSSLAFGNQVVNTTSAVTTVTLANTGTAPLSIVSIAKAGADAAHFNLLTSPAGGFTCLAGASSLAAGANCTFGVSFAPTTTGAKSASIAVTSNAAGSPHSIPLSGTGTQATPDFTLTAQAPTSVTVNAGQPASFTIAVAGQNGFSSAVTFTCSSPAARTGCTANPGSVTPPGNTTVTVTTAARSGMPPAAPWRMRPWPVYAPLLALVAVFVILLTLVRARRVRLALSLPLAVVVLALVFQAAGCGGGGGGGGGSTGTPAGAYTITVMGTSGGATHNTPVTLVVN